MKNYNTPRTLADCQFTTGYGLSQHPRSRPASRTERMAGVLLAVAIGICLAALLAHWAAA